MRSKAIVASILLTLAGAVLLAMPSTKAINETIDLPSVVSSTPVSWTPRVPGEWNVDDDGDGVIEKTNEVVTLAPLGNMMYAGGTFDEVKSADGKTSYPRSNIFAFNATTGVVNDSFKPTFNKPVNVIVPSADGNSLYIGGEFNQMNGVKLAKSYLVKINATTGALDPTFVAPTLNGKINDLDFVHGRLVIAGKFTTVNGESQPGIASLNANTGAKNTYINVKMSGALNATSPLGAYRIAMNPTATKLAVVGSFKKVNDKSRLQLFVMNVNSTSSGLANWDSPILHNAQCSLKTSGTAAVIEDMDFNANGRYLFIVTGGGPRPGICDAIVKFDLNATGTNVKETWVNKTHGDTLRSVEFTSTALYVAGHQRWLSNVAGGTNANKLDRAGIGAVAPGNGSALTWNPGKGREIGSRELIVTNSAQQPGQPTGLWVGSDSGNCGVNVGITRNTEGLCFFPIP